MSIRNLLAVPFLPALLCFAQDPRGSIVGQVTDPSGAVVPNARIRLTHAETNVGSSVTTNEAGNFEAHYLVVGRYKLAAEMQGFKLWERAAVELRIGDRLRIDIQLEVGSGTESVQVTAEAPVLESATASVGQVIDSRQFANMPMRSGSISWIYSMAPGVVWNNLPYDGPWNIDQASALTVGGAAGGVDFNVDGVSNNSYGGRTAYVPPPDMVQEVKVETTSYDAAIGHTSGASINVALKSGTNRLGGTLGALVSSGPMMTRNFFTNRFIYDPATGPITPEKIKANTPSLRWLRYSAAVGGPLLIPKFYDGRNRTFWMFGYQTHNRRRPNATLNAVPTEAMRRGDFSALLALGAAYQIYDPYTTRPSGASRFSRSPLAGNIVPTSRIAPAAQTILKYFPLPNAAGTADFLQNYSRTRQDTQDLYQPTARLDHNFSEKHRVFGRYSHSDFYGHFDEYVAGSAVRGRRRMRPHRGVALDNVLVLSPSTVLDVRYGFTWFREYESFDNIGWNLSEFGFPAGLISQLNPQAISFPQIGVSGMLQLGNNGGFSRKYYSHSLLAVLNFSRGNHSLKAGFDGRLALENAADYGNVSPLLNFAEAYTRGPLDNSPIAPGTGQGFASFLFGIPTGGGVDVNDSRAERSPFYSWFVQDDWRLSRKLTLNLGLRWEYEGPNRERYNRSSRDFDFKTVNPIQDTARALYARSPIPEIAAADFRTLGGLTFLGRNGAPTTIRPGQMNAFMPRFGYAYQMSRALVLRGGYGIFFSLIGSEFTDVAQPGFNQRTNIVSSNDNGQTYVASIANPLPGGLDKPPGASGGLTTFLGRSPGFFPADGRRPYSQRWSQSVQFEFLKRTVMEAGYIGSRSTRLRAANEFNPTPERYLSTLPVRDQATIDYLSARVVNPFAGIEGFRGTAFFTGANSTRAQLLQPYPHFNSLAGALPAGMSWYHAGFVRLERRFSAGLQLQFNYTWSRTMEAVAYRNATDSLPEHVVSEADRPHRLTASGIYELPFGRGRRFAAQAGGFLNSLIGGWQTQAILQFQSGPGLAFGNVIYSGTYAGLKLPGSQQSLYQWFNTANFERNNQKQLANNLRTLPTRFSTVRADGINTLDLAVHKNFKIRELFTVQLRGEAEGALNHPNFSPPNLAPTSTLFGQVAATQTGQEERRIFVGLKLMF